MLNDHMKLMKIFASSEEIIGRKKLQKMVYIAKKLGFPFHEKFEFHFYGPYSEELTLRIEELCNLGFIEEKIEEKGGYHQYQYKITPTGREFLNVDPLQIPHLQECLSQLNKQNARFLELVSTILYFDHDERKMVEDKIHSLKGNQDYTQEEIQEAYQYIEELSQHTFVL